MSNFLVYRASAGSGKTFTLALQYVKLLLLCNKNEYKHILAVTFTNAATNEMKMRILEYLFSIANNLDINSNGVNTYIDFFLKPPENINEEDLVSKKIRELAEKDSTNNFVNIKSKAATCLHNILHDYSKFYVLTIDGFFQKIVHNLAQELGIASRFNLELDILVPISEAVDELIIDITDPKNKVLLNRVLDFVNRKLEDGKWSIEKDLKMFGKYIFNESFQEKNSKLSRENKISLINEIEDFRKECRKTVKAFEESIDNYCNDFFSLCNSYNLTISDFQHNGVFNFFNNLKYKTYKIEGNKNVEKYIDTPEKLFKKESPGYNNCGIYAEIVKNLYKDVLSKMNEGYRLYNSASKLMRYCYQFELLEYIDKKIDKQSVEKNRFMLAKTALILSNIIKGGDAPFIYEKLDRSLNHILIDEFQDTSKLQYSNFIILLSELLSKMDVNSPQHTVLLVGDVKQAIYRWRNGDAEILQKINSPEKKNELNLINNEVFKEKELKTNFRSTDTVIRFNNTLFEIIKLHFSDNIRQVYKDVEQIPKSTKEGFVSLSLLPKEGNINLKQEQLKLVLNNLIQLYNKGIAPDKIAIICRKNDSIRYIAEQLPIFVMEHFQNENTIEAMQQEGYFSIISSEAFVINNSKAIQLIIACLRLLDDTSNKEFAGIACLMWKKYSRFDWYKNFNSWDIKHIDDNFPEGFKKKDWQYLKHISLIDLIKQLVIIFKINDNENEAPFLTALFDDLIDFLKTNESNNLALYLKHWDEKAFNKTLFMPTDETNRKGISAITIHKSKGLEFHTVIVPDCNWTLLPNSKKMLFVDKENFNCGFDKAPPFIPVKYEAPSDNISFSEELEKEKFLTYWDNINLLYVALTRARNNLFIVSPEPKSKNDTIFSLLEDVVNCISNNFFPKGENFLNQLEIINNNSICFGKIEEIKEIPCSNLSTEQVTVKNPFKKSTINFTKKRMNLGIKNALPGSFMIGETTKFSSSQSKSVIKGLDIHEILSRIEFLDNFDTDIEKAIKEAKLNGKLKSANTDYYLNEIKSFIVNSGKKEWFTEKNNYKILNECSILSRDSSHKNRIINRRPDRVMIDKDNNVIVVDYKTGPDHKKYTSQLQEYLKLFRELGYSKVEAYLWFTHSGKITHITL